MVLQNHNGWATRAMKKFGDIFIRFDTIPACDGQTDRRTRDDSNRRAAQKILRVKIISEGYVNQVK